MSPPACRIWRLVRAWSKAPGDTGRACPLPSSRVCGVLRAALACRERGPWPGTWPSDLATAATMGLDARARRGGEVRRGFFQPTREVFRRRRVCVLRATPSDRGCDSEPGPPPGIKLRGHELDSHTSVAHARPALAEVAVRASGLATSRHDHVLATRHFPPYHYQGCPPELRLRQAWYMRRHACIHTATYCVGGGPTLLMSTPG